MGIKKYDALAKRICHYSDMAQESKPKLKTVDVRQTERSLIKPTELVSFRELQPLTVAARKSLNLMIASAWSDITKKNFEHRIPIADLKFSNEGDARLTKTLRSVMGAQIELKFRRDDQDYIKQAPIFIEIDRPIDHGRGYVYFKFSDLLVDVITDSTIYTRMHKQLMLSLQSKYSLALYELIESRRRLKYHQTIKKTVTDWRDALGVPRDAFKLYGDFKRRAWLPAVAELNHLAEFRVEWLEIKDGRQVHEIDVIWLDKTPQERIEALNELQASSVGRKARREGTVETVSVDEKKPD